MFTKCFMVMVAAIMFVTAGCGQPKVDVVVNNNGTTAGCSSIEVATAAGTMPTIGVGETVQFYAYCVDTNGAKYDITPSVGWGSSSTTTATFSTVTPGLLTGVATGQTTVTATVGSLFGSTIVTVSATAASSLSLTDSAGAALPTTMTVGDTLQLKATLTDSVGNATDVTSVVTYSSSSTTTATVSSAGLVTAVSAGSTMITASYYGTGGELVFISQSLVVDAAAAVSLSLTDSAGAALPTAITVGDTLQLKATLTDSAGSLDVTTGATYSSSSATTATVGTAGAITAMSPGSVTITATYTATSGEVSASYVVTINAAPVITMVVTATNNDLILTTGGTRQLSAVGYDAMGNATDVTATAVWGSSDTGVIAVDAAGVASYVAPGSATITATYGSLVSGVIMTAQ